MNLLVERRLEEKERRRGEILDATCAVIAEVGIDQLTMDEVAKRARLSRALLYVYFRDKSDLMFAICSRALEDLLGRFVTITQRGGLGREQILAMGHAFVDFSRESPLHYEALASFATYSHGEIDAESAEAGCFVIGDRVHAEMVSAVEQGMRDGSIRGDAGPPMLVALTLWGYMHGVIQLARTKAAVIERRGFDPAQLIEHGLLLAGLALAGAEQEPGGDRREM